ncbi:MAG: hypothetical protein V2A73_01710 [Pseudomonadota bacterium]
MSKHHGQWQAQGDDIKKTGHRREWGQDTVPTKGEGLTWARGRGQMHCKRVESS